jgi:hypothetical protein
MREKEREREVIAFVSEKRLFMKIKKTVRMNARAFGIRARNSSR